MVMDDILLFAIKPHPPFFVVRHVLQDLHSDFAFSHFVARFLVFKRHT